MRSDIIHQEHAQFRQILQAMSHPGSLIEMAVPTSNTTEIAPAIHILTCLMDNEVTFSVVGDDKGAVAAALSLQTGSPQVDIATSDFVVAVRGTTDGQLAMIKRGTLEYPDGGATLVYLIDELAEDGGSAELSGPGINGSCRPRFTGLASGELSALREANAEYPLGVDALFVDSKGRIACIPRSTRIGGN
jgi:alpha-D-ribose 1-methylphosphonate 5-triphosphate synthase subunit PhnH